MAKEKEQTPVEKIDDAYKKMCKIAESSSIKPREKKAMYSFQDFLEHMLPDQRCSPLIGDDGHPASVVNYLEKELKGYNEKGAKLVQDYIDLARQVRKYAEEVVASEKKGLARRCG